MADETSAIWGNYIFQQNEQMHTDFSKAVSLYASWGPTFSLFFFWINKNYAKEKVLRNFTALTHPKIPSCPTDLSIGISSLFDFWFLSWEATIILQPGLRPQSKINTVCSLQGQDLKPRVTVGPRTFFLLPLDGVTQKWRSYPSACIMEKPPGKMTHFSEFRVHIQHKPLLSICLEY